MAIAAKLRATVLYGFGFDSGGLWYYNHQMVMVVNAVQIAA